MCTVYLYMVFPPSNLESSCGMQVIKTNGWTKRTAGYVLGPHLFGPWHTYDKRTPDTALQHSPNLSTKNTSLKKLRSRKKQEHM